MEIFTEILKIIGRIIGWMEIHPVVSAGIFTIVGVLLSAVLDIRRHTLNIVSRTKNSIKQSIKISKTSWIFNLLNNWSFNFGGTRKAVGESKEDFRQKIVSEAPQSPLIPIQITICKEVASITEVHSTKKFDPKSLYEEAVREKNSNGVESAAIKYYQLFNKITKALENIAVEKNAKTEIENLIFVVGGLGEMLNKPTEQEVLRRQFDDCERAIIRVLAIIYEPN